MFFIDWKQNKKQDKNIRTIKQNKKIAKNETNIETERQKHTPWKQKQKQLKKQPKMKATWFS